MPRGPGHAIETSPLAGGACTVQVLATEAAPTTDGSRPEHGWVPVTLPDQWARRWPQHEGSAWYRITWQRHCQPGTAPSAALMGLGVDGLSVAGEVYINEDLLWRDASLTEPLSRSWNVPRWWWLPESSIGPGTNAIWIRVVGHRALSPGMGALRLGAPEVVADAYGNSLWRQRTLYQINAVLSALAVVLFGVVWCLRRGEQAHGWFALMSLSWLAYLSTFLATTMWPFSNSVSRSQASLLALMGFVVCACKMSLRIGGLRWPRAERVLWGLAALGALVLLMPMPASTGWRMTSVWQGAIAVFLVNGLLFQRHAWFPRQGSRQLAHMLLACCWLMFMGVALHDVLILQSNWQVARSWAALCGVLTVALMTLLLGAQLAQQMTTVERFNRVLKDRVAHARAELTEALATAHTQALNHAKLQERMQIAHDLHDGLGASLVRGMALVEQSPQPVNNARTLSLLKSLRDDLRQVIDQGSSAGATVPASPVQWLAPLRHRFTRIFDELDVTSSWQVPSQWQDLGGQPSVLQCLALTRIVEECLSNVIKHSQARHVRVHCTALQPQGLQLCIEDDGVGFDVVAVREAGQSVGMRSMAARAARIGGTLDLTSGVCGTQVCVSVPLLPPADWPATAARSAGATPAPEASAPTRAPEPV
ncbi:ATP-binding protein [Comamonas serinivorans]|uniref:sensor histidine kinase n=1 Tax=Comamonas serinivorans TaxID=1082851 RepID=UPI0012F90A17|nr:ATP-binding protein [Comamonas serinivorans]